MRSPTNYITVPLKAFIDTNEIFAGLYKAFVDTNIWGILVDGPITTKIQRRKCFLWNYNKRIKEKLGKFIYINY